MPRALDAEARAEQVLDALWAIAAADGLEAVTARAVAARAGLSLGSVTRAYPRQADLHVAAMQRVSTRVGSRLASTPALGAGPGAGAGPGVSGDDPVADGVRLLAQVLPLEPDTRAEALVYYAYLARARVDPTLRPLADEVDDALRALSARVVAALLPHALPQELRDHVEELHAVTEGLAFGLVTWPDRRSPDDARATLTRHLERLERLERLGRLGRPSDS